MWIRWIPANISWRPAAHWKAAFLIFKKGGTLFKGRFFSNFVPEMFAINGFTTSFADE
jgi:hypothetical protein